MSGLKPILRIIMEWLTYVYGLNGFLSGLFSLLFGGAFLKRLLTIREFSRIDNSKSLAMALIGISIVAVFAIKFGLIWAYQQDQIQMLFLSNAPQDEMMQFQRQMGTIKFILEIIISLTQTLFLSLNTIWFMYIMYMFRKCIEQMQEDVKRGKKINKRHTLSMFTCPLLPLNFNEFIQPQNWTSCNYRCLRPGSFAWMRHSRMRCASFQCPSPWTCWQTPTCSLGIFATLPNVFLLVYFLLK